MNRDITAAIDAVQARYPQYGPCEPSDLRWRVVYTKETNMSKDIRIKVDELRTEVTLVRARLSEILRMTADLQEREAPLTKRQHQIWTEISDLQKQCQHARHEATDGDLCLDCGAEV